MDRAEKEGPRLINSFFPSFLCLVHSTTTYYVVVIYDSERSEAAPHSGDINLKKISTFPLGTLALQQKPCFKNRYPKCFLCEPVPTVRLCTGGLYGYGPSRFLVKMASSYCNVVEHTSTTTTKKHMIHKGSRLGRNNKEGTLLPLSNRRWESIKKCRNAGRNKKKGKQT